MSCNNCTCQDKDTGDVGKNKPTDPTNPDGLSSLINRVSVAVSLVNGEEHHIDIDAGREEYLSELMVCRRVGLLFGLLMPGVVILSRSQAAYVGGSEKGDTWDGDCGE